MNHDFFNSIFGQAANFAQQQFSSDRLEEIRRAANAQNQFAGTPVSDEEKRAMAIRRCGNLCKDAIQAGWRLQMHVTGFGYRGIWENAARQSIICKIHPTQELALIQATETLEPFLK